MTNTQPSTKNNSIGIFSADEESINQINIAASSLFKVYNFTSYTDDITSSEDFINSDIIIYDLDGIDFNEAILHVIAIKKSDPLKALIIIGEKETINTFINGDIELLVFRVFAKPIRPNQMLLLLKSAAGFKIDHSGDDNKNATLTIIDRIESQNVGSFFNKFKVPILACASLFIIAFTSIAFFSSSNDNDQFIANDRANTNSSSNLASSQILDAPISTESSLLIVGSLDIESDPIAQAEDEALLAELDAQLAAEKLASSEKKSVASIPKKASSQPVINQKQKSKPKPKPKPKPQPKPQTVAKQQPIAKPVVKSPATLPIEETQITKLVKPNDNQSNSVQESLAPAISSPVLISRTNPSYPRAAFARNIEGWVDINIQIDENGDVSDVEIIDSEPGRIFNRVVKKAVSKWKYSPAIESASQQPVSSSIQELRITFKISN